MFTERSRREIRQLYRSSNSYNAIWWKIPDDTNSDNGRKTSSIERRMRYSHNDELWIWSYLSKWSPFHGAVYAITESIAKIVASGGDYRNIRLTFHNTLNVLEKTRHAGDSRLQHCLVHIRHRWDLDLHQSVERTVCLEHSMILMYHQHWYLLQSM